MTVSHPPFFSTFAEQVGQSFVFCAAQASKSWLASSAARGHAGTVSASTALRRKCPSSRGRTFDRFDVTQDEELHSSVHAAAGELQRPQVRLFVHEAHIKHLLQPFRVQCLSILDHGRRQHLRFSIRPVFHLINHSQSTREFPNERRGPEEIRTCSFELGKAFAMSSTSVPVLSSCIAVAINTVNWPAAALGADRPSQLPLVQRTCVTRLPLAESGTTGRGGG